MYISFFNVNNNLIFQCITGSEQFTTAKRGCANVLLNTSNRIESVRLDWLVHTAGLQDRILLNYTRIANAHCAKTLSIFCYV